jgi:hypothetical protein
MGCVKYLRINVYNDHSYWISLTHLLMCTCKTVLKCCPKTLHFFNNFFQEASTACFGICGHHQVLYICYCAGDCYAPLVLFLVQSHLCGGASLGYGLLPL